MVLPDVIAATALADRRLHARHRPAARRDARPDRRRRSVATAAPVSVVRPDAAGGRRATSRAHGDDAFYDSVRAAQALLRDPQGRAAARALAGQAAPGSPGCAAAQSVDARRRWPLRGVRRACTASPKFNPLADWSEDDVWAYVRAHDVPYNPLHDRGYRSIGCAPCTRADPRRARTPRAGRWWWEIRRHEGVRPARRPQRTSRRESRRKRGMTAAVLASRPVRRRRTGAALPRPPRLARVRSDPHPARGRRPVRRTRRCSSRAARTRCVLLRLAEKAFRPGALPVPAAAHRHRPQLPRGDRVPRRARARSSASG